jgi:hypothetical protein
MMLFKKTQAASVGAACTAQSDDRGLPLLRIARGALDLFTAAFNVLAKTLHRITCA